MRLEIIALHVALPVVTFVHQFCARMGYGAREGVMTASMRRMTPVECARYALRVAAMMAIISGLIWVKRYGH